MTTSTDPDIAARLAFADTEEGRAKARRCIAERHMSGSYCIGGAVWDASLQAWTMDGSPVCGCCRKRPTAPGMMICASCYEARHR